MLASSWVTPTAWSYLHVFFSGISSNPLFIDRFQILFARWRELLSNRCQAGREMMNSRTHRLSLWPLHHIQRIAIIISLYLTIRTDWDKFILAENVYFFFSWKCEQMAPKRNFTHGYYSAHGLMVERGGNKTCSRKFISQFYLFNPASLNHR